MFRRLVAMLTCVMFLVGCVASPILPSSPPTPMAKVKLGYVSLSGASSVIWYAFEQGFFQTNGLDVELVYFESGTTGATAMISGDIDFCEIGGAAIVNAIVAGAPITIIGGLFNTYIYSLVATPDIQSVSDLQGKSLAISQPGSSSDHALRVALHHLGLDPDKDVNILSIGSRSERIAAMTTGQIVGTLVSPPDNLKAYELGFHTLFDMIDLDVPYLFAGIAARDEFLEDRRDISVRMMKAISQAMMAMKSDPEGAKTVMAQYLTLDPITDKAALDETYDVFIQKYLVDVPYPTLPGIQQILDDLVAENPAAASFQVEDLVDLSIVGKLESDGLYSTSK